MAKLKKPDYYHRDPVKYEVTRPHLENIVGENIDLTTPMDTQGPMIGEEINNMNEADRKYRLKKPKKGK
jgi:hypothetical protein